MRISDWSSDVCSSDLDMSPPAKRLRGRRNQMQWLLDQLTEALDEQSLMQMPAIKPALHAAMLEDWNALDAAWQQRDDEAPAFYGLAAILRRLSIEQAGGDEVGSASGRERVGQSVWIPVVAVSIKNKKCTKN